MFCLKKHLRSDLLFSHITLHVDNYLAFQRGWGPLFQVNVGFWYLAPLKRKTWFRWEETLNIIIDVSALSFELPSMLAHFGRGLGFFQGDKSGSEVTRRQILALLVFELLSGSSVGLLAEWGGQCHQLSWSVWETEHTQSHFNIRTYLSKLSL